MSQKKQSDQGMNVARISQLFVFCTSEPLLSFAAASVVPKFDKVDKSYFNVIIVMCGILESPHNFQMLKGLRLALGFR